MAKIGKPYLPITVIGTKYDIFQQQYEPGPRKVFCQALRYLCHKNGCDLVFSSTSTKDPQPLKLFKNVMGWHVFRLIKLASQPEVQVDPAAGKDAEKEAQEKEDQTNYFAIPQPRRDPQNALMIFAGTDSHAKIGEPPGAANRSNATEEQLWAEEVKKRGM